MNPDVKKHLRPEERETYNDMLEIQAGNCPEERWQWREAMIHSLESLAAERELSETRRALLDEARDLFIWWIGCDQEAMQNCSKFREEVLVLIDAIATALKGVGGE